MTIYKPKPISLAMIICDTIIEDSKTGKKSIIGMFNNIFSEKIPCIHSQISILILLTEGTGKYPIKVRCLQVGEEKEILTINGNINFENPHQIVDMNIELDGVEFPQYGDYRFEVLTRDTLICARRFTVSKVKKKR